jgi:hypothetical protein
MKASRASAAEVRRLGLIFLAASVLLCALAAWKARAGHGLVPPAGPHPWTGALRPGALRAIAAAVFAAAGLYCLALGERARGVHRAWTALGEALGRIVSPIVLAVLYYVVVTPFGLLSRLRRRDPLGLKPDPKAPTYWRAPESKRTDRQRLLRQY